MADNINHRKARNPPPPRNLEADLNSMVSKKKNFTSATFRGLGCAASSHVSVPAAIRTSATWEPKRKSRTKRLSTRKINDKLPVDGNNPTSQSSLSLACSSSSDVWCGPAALNDVDCVVSTRPSRPKLNRILLAQRELYTSFNPFICQGSYTVRRMVIPEDNPFVETDAGLGLARIRTDVTGSRYRRHVSRHGLREGLDEIVMLQSNMLMGGRPNRLDRYSDLRLDVDNMSYEVKSKWLNDFAISGVCIEIFDRHFTLINKQELLELGDQIGYVSTGLREDEITHCLRRIKLASFENLSTHFTSESERKCSICQEEYEENDEAGTLNCGHSFHVCCIKQWLEQKNTCPICKTAASSQT
ncbi:RING/U-box superfamily protein [Striga asiatica]|uniref:RING-type E3 ubiquitin transferase n=1 Tax=Striga asiatica TaxID=4170 RepID=A0A5A7PIE6_STRAF|nr:RING/U-box superfamily protein [Striga asiatica]